MPRTQIKHYDSSHSASEGVGGRIGGAGIIRRDFLKGLGGLVLAIAIPGCTHGAAQAGAAATGAAGAGTAAGQQAVGAWVNIGSDESITLLIGGSELGQGIYTGLSQVIAEELKVDWSRVRALPCPADQAWGTGGSSGIRGHFDAMRLAGASAREMLIAAAAQKWGVPANLCQAQNGAVYNGAVKAAVGGPLPSLTYGALAELAATLPVPDNPPLTPPNQFQMIGKPLPRTDIPAKVDGSAIYGIDVRVPNMVYATMLRCPYLGGWGSPPQTTPAGAIALVPVDGGLAVVASNTWQAMQIAQSISAQTKWTKPSNADTLDTDQILAAGRRVIASGPVNTSRTSGDPDGALASAAHAIDSTYRLPNLAHTCMEVLNCSAEVTPDSCTVWAPTQNPGAVLDVASRITGLPSSAITVNRTYVGGGFGRKAEMDYVGQAIQVAKAVGKPVKLTWTREDDIMFDHYRPMALVRVRGGVDSDGNITGWIYRVVGQEGGGGGGPYHFGAERTEEARLDSRIPTGAWRSVGESIHVFARECAIDELAQAQGKDPLTWRRSLLAHNDRATAVIDAVANMSGWSTPPAAGHARGVAYSDGFGSMVAQVAEVSAPKPGSMIVHKVWCVIDCGTAVNPDAVASQLQGAINMGLSAALWGQVPFKDGAAAVNNFDDYRIVTLREAPDVDVQVLSSGGFIGGVGEPGVPVIMPAVANAYAAATGKRLRDLPLFGASAGSSA